MHASSAALSLAWAMHAKHAGRSVALPPSLVAHARQLPLLLGRGLVTQLLQAAAESAAER